MFLYIGKTADERTQKFQEENKMCEVLTTMAQSMRYLFFNNPYN